MTSLAHDAKMIRDDFEAEYGERAYEEMSIAYTRVLLEMYRVDAQVSRGYVRGNTASRLKTKPKAESKE